MLNWKYVSYITCTYCTLCKLQNQSNSSQQCPTSVARRWQTGLRGYTIFQWLSPGNQVSNSKKSNDNSCSCLTILSESFQGFCSLQYMCATKTWLNICYVVCYMFWAAKPFHEDKGVRIGKTILQGQRVYSKYICQNGSGNVSYWQMCWEKTTSSVELWAQNQSGGIKRLCWPWYKHNIIINHRWNLHLHLLCLMTGTSYILGTRSQQIMRLNTIMIVFFFSGVFWNFACQKGLPSLWVYFSNFHFICLLLHDADD